MCPYIHIGSRIIPTYGLCIALALVLASALAIYRTSKQKYPTDPLLVIIAVTTGGAMIGAKLLYITVSIPLAQLWEQLLSGDFSAFSGGGLVFYGGLLAGIGSAFLGAWISKVRLADYESAIVPCIPLAHAIGRVGCLLAGCCYGIPYSGPLSITQTIYQNGRPIQTSVFPVQILESVLNIIICIILLVFTRKPRRKFSIIKLYFLCYAIERFFLEFLRGDLVRGIFARLSLSQWISCGVMVILCLDILVFSHLRINKKI